MTIIQKGLELDPLSAVLRSNLGFYLTALGRFEEARQVFERGIELDSDANFARFGLAMLEAWAYDSIDKAVVLLSQIIRDDPTSARYMAVAGMLYLNLGDFDSAEEWLDLSIVVQPDNGIQKPFRLSLEILRGDHEQASAQAEDIYAYIQDANEWEGNALSLLRDTDITNGRQDEALQRYAAVYPEIVNSDVPAINRFNYSTAVDIAYLYFQSGNEERGRQLVEAAIPIIESVPIRGFWGSGWGNARTYALLGRNAEALAELQRGVNADWRLMWRYAFDHDPIFNSLRGRPEFKAMRETIAADMAEQLERVRKLEATGEIFRPEMLADKVSASSEVGL